MNKIFLQQLKNRLSEFLPEMINISYFQDKLSEISNWGLEGLLLAFQAKGIFNDPSISYHAAEIIETLSVLPVYHSLLTELLNLLTKKNWLNMRKEHVYSLANKTRKITKEYFLTKEEESEKNVGLEAHIDLLETVLKNYFLVISGSENFLSFLFPKGSFDIVNTLYQANPIADFYNKLTSSIIQLYSEHCLPKNNPINILEIGAGTGSTTMQVLPSLHNLTINEYRYTDISTAFLSYGIEKFRKNFAFLQFSKFDINQSAEQQGLHKRAYDIIFATNAIHNAHNLRETLSEIYLLLRPGGILILNEGIIKSDYSTIVYGLSFSWWGFVDEDLRIKGSPLLSTIGWKNLLSMTSFQNFFSLNKAFFPDIKLDQDIIFAVK